MTTRPETLSQEELLADDGQRPTEPIALECFGLNGGAAIRREIRFSNGALHRSEISLGSSLPPNSDLGAAFDAAWLRADQKPRGLKRHDPVRVADLFSGCGAMTLGVAEAARALEREIESVVAMDTNPAAQTVFEANFPGVRVVGDPIQEVLDGELGDRPTQAERQLVMEVGPIDVLVAGPPCQGHSDLNNRTRRSDPKNALYRKVARFAETVRPTHLIIENVRGIVHDRGGAFQDTRDHLERLGYEVDAGLVRGEELGVPQRRHRMFLVASRSTEVSVERLLAPFRTGERTFWWACSDLEETDPDRPFHQASNPHAISKRRIDYLFDEGLYELPDSERPDCHRETDHTYVSVYGRLRKDRPAATITTGFTCMGQGRFVHPTRRRTLTPHEAARLQLIPDWFAFGDLKREQYKTLIGNAVPPKLTYALAVGLLAVT